LDFKKSELYVAFKFVQVQNTPVQVQNVDVLQSLHQSKGVTVESTNPQVAINML
jgi:hypothetical protein